MEGRILPEKRVQLILGTWFSQQHQSVTCQSRAQPLGGCTDSPIEVGIFRSPFHMRGLCGTGDRMGTSWKVWHVAQNSPPLAHMGLDDLHSSLKCMQF